MWLDLERVCAGFDLELVTTPKLKETHFENVSDLLTICSNPTIAIIISGAQEALGLLVRQNASPRNKPLEEKPGGHRDVKVRR